MFPSISSLEMHNYNDVDWNDDANDPKYNIVFYNFVSRSSIEVEYHEMVITSYRIVKFCWFVVDICFDVP